MLLQNTLDLSTFEIVRFRIWNQTSNPDDYGVGTKYFNTNSGHEGYNRENIYTATGWRKTAYMDDIDKVNEKLDLIFGDELDTDTIIDSWKEVQDFLAGIEDTKTLMTMLDGKVDHVINMDPSAYKTLGYGRPDEGWLFYGPAISFGTKTYFAQIQVKHDGDQIVFRRHTNQGFTEWQTLIHTGNVGGYALKSYGNQGAVDYNDVFYNGIQYVSGQSNNTPIKYGILMSASIGDASWQLLGGRINEGLYFRGGGKDNTTWGDWKTIAFTDSDITGNAATATKLKNKVSLWGNEFDGTQSLNGDMKFANNTALYIQTSDKTAYRNLFYYDTSNTLFIGRDAGENGERVSIFGSPLVFGTSRASTAMTITDGGRVVVGPDASVDGDKLYSRGRVNILSLCDNPTLGNMPEYGLVMTDNRSTLGIAQWVSNGTGAGNIQVGRFDGTATVYALNLNPLGGAVYVGGNLAPNANNSLSLGTSSYRWSDVYSVGGNFSGRVLIGGAEDDGSIAKLQVNGSVAIGNENDSSFIMRRDAANRFIASRAGGHFAWRVNGEATDAIILGADGLATFNGGALIPTGQTLTIGSVTFKETATGEIEVDGNLHTTGTLASGGKGEVGENTTGNAMVYQYDLASGESVYTVDNVKGSTNVIVQIFEWNSNTSSWDMILTDVSVKADAITVTFGRTTTVNHMVTVC